MQKDSKIYVAGHTGMVGSAIVRKLRSEGFNNLILKSHAELDLLRQSDVEKLFKKEMPEYVMVAAARVGGIAANQASPADFLYENLEMQNNVIWSAHKSGVKRLLFLGSSCIYPRDCPQPMKEEYFMDGKVEPTNEGYAIAKIAGVKLCEMISRQFNKEFFSCLPTNIYGENDNFDLQSSHVIPALIRKIHDAKIKKEPELTVWGTGKARREFLEVNDLADACLFLMENFVVSDKTLSFINIGTGEDVSIKELVGILSEIIGYEGKIIWDSEKPDGMPRKWLDVSRLYSLGWKHKTDLKSGLKVLYAWFLKQASLR